MPWRYSHDLRPLRLFSIPSFRFLFSYACLSAFGHGPWSFWIHPTTSFGLVICPTSATLVVLRMIASFLDFTRWRWISTRFVWWLTMGFIPVLPLRRKLTYTSIFCWKIDIEGQGDLWIPGSFPRQIPYWSPPLSNADDGISQLPTPQLRSRVPRYWNRPQRFHANCV